MCGFKAQQVAICGNSLFTTDALRSTNSECRSFFMYIRSVLIRFNLKCHYSTYIVQRYFSEKEHILLKQRWRFLEFRGSQWEVGKKLKVRLSEKITLDGWETEEVSETSLDIENILLKYTCISSCSIKNNHIFCKVFMKLKCAIFKTEVISLLHCDDKIKKS